jgi:hypothetical protein
MTKICTIYQGANDFYDTTLALRYLFRASESIQKDNHLQEQRFNFDRLAYAKEWATIRMTAARRTGNTKAVADLCNYLDLHWLILSCNLNMVEHTRLRCEQLHNHKIIRSNKRDIISKNVWLSFGSIRSVDSYKGLKLRGIIVDGASNCNEAELGRVYELQPSMDDYATEHFLFVV